MCGTCGCGHDHEHDHHHDHRDPAIAVLEPLLGENDREAAHNRAHFDAHGVLAVNLMSSPGSGKTALLEATIVALGAKGVRIAVVVGDLETENDAERIRRHGVPAVQITTGMACHLDALMVHRALHDLDLAAIDLLFIENVGNLVCPASFDLGQHADVVLLSVTEGDDKPAKYPVMFRAADHVLVTKADLLPYIEEFRPERAARAVADLDAATPVSVVSAKTGEGLAGWFDWLAGLRAARMAGEPA
ncbi:Hydrogenase nickel incorporation protein HypB [uncultured Alphaproteobacteria bacterium]|uniref:Hydrogenase maturation factor HypB n=1 Tax=uncultured Alphaproteobacteria bacterium TaxID=91750 RepID=A0A212K324_9PROT|nr:Hydrogenase nickel incorporation protein HypB [uncultured Alphaproteobacteria bacterium]